MDSLCRTCMRSLPNLLPLFENDDLQIKIETLTSIQITKDDRRFPSKICGECIDSINKFYNFRIIIINNDLDFRKRYLASQKQTMDDEDIGKIEGDLGSEIHENNRRTSENCETLINVNEIGEVDIKDWDISVVKSEIFEIDTDEEKVTEHQTKENVNITQTINDRIATIMCNQRFHNCTECGFKAKDYITLKAHKKMVHFPKGICNVCGKSVRMDNMTKHMKNHTEDKVTCPKCGAQLKNSGSLRTHLLTHVNVKIICDICGVSYKNRQHYYRHKKKHRDIKKIKCSICNKEFLSGGMKRHMRSHTGERPYPCKYCGKGFSSSYAVKAHTRQHTNERPYSCEHCSMSFHHKVSLKTHLASKH